MSNSTTLKGSDSTFAAMDFFQSYSEAKLKPYLKIGIQRIQNSINKKSTAVKHQKREVAELLRNNKDEKARIKTEHIIREDFTIESYELLELLCELIHERVRQITNNKECPTELYEAVVSILWASQNVEIAEFDEVKKQFSKKYGVKFVKAALNNEGDIVNKRLCQKLTYKPPSTVLVTKYLEEIAKYYQVEWTPSDAGCPEDGGMLSEAPLGSPQGFSVPMAPGSDLRQAYSRGAGSSPETLPVPPNNLDEDERAKHEAFLRNQNQAGAGRSDYTYQPPTYPPQAQAYQQHSSPQVYEEPTIAVAEIINLDPLSLSRHYDGSSSSSMKADPTAMQDHQQAPSSPVANPSPTPGHASPIEQQLQSPPVHNPDPVDELQARLAALQNRSP